MMEQYDRWRNGQEISNLSGRSYKADARVWRAALKWVENDCIYTEEDGHQCISQGMIDEELEGGD